MRKILGQHGRDGVNASGDVSDQALKHTVVGISIARNIWEFLDDLFDHLVEILGER